MDFYKDISPGLPQDWPSLVEAVALIDKSVSDGRRIAVWGHDDLDGIASTAILMDSLRGRADILYYIPPKHGSHYGLDKSIIDQMVQKQAGLIITVDGGISNYQEAEHCRGLGLPLIITDHHELPAKLPPATVLLNPKIDEDGRPYPHLAGAGVSLFLASALSGFKDEKWHLKEPRRLAWASLATVSDRVPLAADNRALLKDGIPCIAGDQALVRMAGIMGLDLSAGLSPLIIQNSYASLFSASLSEGFSHPMVEMLMGRPDWDYVSGLWSSQQAWKKSFKQFSGKALSGFNDTEPGIIALVDESLPSDMIGPLAGALRDSLGWPAVVIGNKNNRLVGECRGYLPFDFVAMLREMGHRFVQFGGHKQAAGFTVNPAGLKPLLDDISQYSDQHLALISESRPHIGIEYEVDDIRGLLKLKDELAARAPFGPQNPMPACRIKNVFLPETPMPKGFCLVDELLPLQTADNSKLRELTAFLDITHLGTMLLSFRQ
jgi:single-stranded-DNA-specific exonuclease